MTFRKLLFCLGKKGSRVPINWPRDRYLEMREWCNKNLGSRTYKVECKIYGTTFGEVDIPVAFEFLNTEDAVLFKLTWMFEE